MNHKDTHAHLCWMICDGADHRSVCLYISKHASTHLSQHITHVNERVCMREKKQQQVHAMCNVSHSASLSQLHLLPTTTNFCCACVSRTHRHTHTHTHTQTHTHTLSSASKWTHQIPHEYSSVLRAACNNRIVKPKRAVHFVVGVLVALILPKHSPVLLVKKPTRVQAGS